MIFGVVLASGVGRRMKSYLPKQFLEIKGKPIVAYTLLSMLKSELIDTIVLVCHPDFIFLADDIKKRFFHPNDQEKIRVVAGGEERIDSIDNAVDFIMSNYQYGDEDVVLFHDAVRPFITRKIIADSIQGAKKHGAVVAGVPAVDTMLFSEDGEMVSAIPDRSKLYHGQSPDSFRLNHYIELRKNIPEEEKKQVFGTSKICELNNEPIYIIPGDDINFKITTSEDLLRAEFYLSILEEQGCESTEFTGSR